MTRTEQRAKELQDIYSKHTKTDFWNAWKEISKYVEAEILRARIAQLEKVCPRIENNFSHRNIITVINYHIKELQSTLSQLEKEK